MKKKFIIFNISGGLGKNIMATAVVRALNKKFPKHKIIITTAHKDVWLSNPRIEEVINPFTEPNLYEKYIYKTDSKIYRLDPYHAEDYVYQRKHLTEIWCDLCGVVWDGPKPELYFTKREEDLMEKLLNLKRDKRPLFMLQVSGGAQNQPFPISWARDIPLPLATKIVQQMNESGFRTIQLRRPDQLQVPGAEYISMSHRQALLAIKYSKLRLLMDSFAQHTAASFELPSTVLWILNDPIVFGYPLHHNVTTKIKKQFRHMPDLYLDAGNITGSAEECPYDTNELFDEKMIMETLLS